MRLFLLSRRRGHVGTGAHRRPRRRARRRDVASGGVGDAGRGRPERAREHDARLGQSRHGGSRDGDGRREQACRRSCAEHGSFGGERRRRGRRDAHRVACSRPQHGRSHRRGRKQPRRRHCLPRRAARDFELAPACRWVRHAPRERSALGVLALLHRQRRAARPAEDVDTKLSPARAVVHMRRSVHVKPHLIGCRRARR
jgi:hypothetical protein